MYQIKRMRYEALPTEEGNLQRAIIRGVAIYAEGDELEQLKDQLLQAAEEENQWSPQLGFDLTPTGDEIPFSIEADKDGFRGLLGGKTLEEHDPLVDFIVWMIENLSPPGTTQLVILDGKVYCGS